jgi:hypothetical protein
MQVPRSIIAVTLLGVLVAACGGTPAATQGPDGPGATTGNGGTATQDPGPGETQSGNGGNGGGEFGSVKFTVSGPFDKTDEFPFIPAASIFGSAQGSVLNFSDPADNLSIVSILVDADGKVIVSFSGTEGQVPGAECTTTDFKVEARSASGKFDCTSAASMTGSGAVVGPGKITGEFSARA